LVSKAYETLKKMMVFLVAEFIIVNNEPYMLKCITVPGLTNESILPQQAREGGITLPELLKCH
jgi:D-alanine-D-alanine ligase